VTEDTHKAQQIKSTKPSPEPDTSPQQQEAESEYQPADVGRRVTAAFIDGCIVAVLFFGLGWLGTLKLFRIVHSVMLFWIIPVVYVLIRDMYRNGRPLSIGKKVAKLDVVTSKGHRPDLVNSIQRNILFFFPPLALCMAGLELYLILRTQEHKRFGDHFGKTLVVQEVI